MKVDLSLKERESVLKQLRIAVALQIELWDVTRAIAKPLDCDLEEVACEVQAASVTADTGLELSVSDLDDFLGVGPWRVTTGRSLTKFKSVQ